MNYTAATYSNINPVVFYGGGFCGGIDPRREQYAGEDVAGVEVPNYKTKYEALQNVIKDNYQLFEVDYYGVDNDNYVDGEGFCCEPKTQQKNARSVPTENVDYEKLQYYYHSDHLGSASYITNLDGEVVQHIEYVPFGEVFLEERNNTWNTPFLFNGKELDEETGLYYYGARYYNPRISLWYGVDPLAEKYPSMSPYNYCANNPIKYIDPDGRESIPSLVDKLANKVKRKVTHIAIETGKAIVKATVSYASNKAKQYVNDTKEDVTKAIGETAPAQVIGATSDFVEEYSEMRERNVIGNDHYHHANANSKATQRGEWGKKTAKVLSDTREVFDYVVKGDSRRDVREDQAANKHGRNIPAGVSATEWNAKFDHTRGGARANPPNSPSDGRTFTEDVIQIYKTIVILQSSIL